MLFVSDFEEDGHSHNQRLADAPPASPRSALRFITTQPLTKPPLADHKMQPLLSRGARPLAKHARAMSGKEIHFGTEGRALMLRGVDQLADAVSVTLGPKGRNAILDQPYGAPKITKDGAISASRGAAAPSRRRRASSLGEEVVGGFFFYFGAVRTASSDRDAPRRRDRRQEHRV